jgi:hypothetical protein
MATSAWAWWRATASAPERRPLRSQVLGRDPELVVGSLGRMTFYCDREEFGMGSISERESREIEAANASGTTPVVFIHGL